MNREILDNKITQWGLDRGIILNGNSIAQVIKLQEEVAEILEALVNNDHDNLALEIGDLYVVCSMIAGIEGLTMNKCIEGAYNKIKDRTGYLREDGVFVKDHPQQTYMEL